MFLPLKPADFDSDLGNEATAPYSYDAYLDAGFHIVRNDLPPTQKHIEIGMFKEGDRWIFYAVRNKQGETLETFDTREDAEHWIKSKSPYFRDSYQTGWRVHSSFRSERDPRKQKQKSAVEND